MNAIRAGFAELAGLFVDDGSLALLAVIWAVLVGLGLRLLHVPPANLAGIVLFAGLAALLAASVWRAARR
ncbi:MAG TPA: hypothetical protein VHY76_01820 [Acetobacteraceae bacterium]|jgi:hypothetical protein|nr:hypothetical protein [Acetobacteraceae bacterium]